MKTDWLVKSLLLLVVIFLGIMALRPYLAPPVVRAQSEDVYPITLRLGGRFTFNGAVLQGSVVLDLRNGNVWGFPDFVQRSEFLDKPLPVSHPVLLGRFALEDLNKK
jgi:hypothetical protein